MGSQLDHPAVCVRLGVFFLLTFIWGFLFENSGRLLASPVYPLKVSANKRYLVDQQNTPFLIHGDAAWSLVSGLDKTKAELYLENRRLKGFNTLIVNLIEHKFKGPVNRYGEGPFTTRADFSTLNDKYFAQADWVIRKAAEKGIQILLAPCYLGYKGTDEGWYEEILANGPSKCRNYGRYLGRRYRDFDNILWLMGADRAPEKALEEVREIAYGIKELDSRHLFSAHCAPEQSAVDCFTQETWLDVNCTYTYEIVHKKLLADYNRVPVMPFFLIESTYEGEHNSTPLQIRRQAYWAILCGATGQIMGNRPIWLFDPGWQAAMDAPGSVSMAHLRALFMSRPWQDLVPDQKHTVVTSGLGEFNGLDYVAAARASDESTVMAYLPAGHAVTMDMSKVSGSQAKVWWFDPRTGRARGVGLFPTRGFKEFTPPDSNDWVLISDDATKMLSATGLSTAK